MQVTELKNESLTLDVKISIPEAEIAKKITEELTDIAKKVKIDGFRVGKVPLSILQKKYLESVKQDILKEKVRDAIKQIVNERNLQLADDPQLEQILFEDGKPLEFVLKFEMLPEFSLPDFSKISLIKPKLKIEEKDIDKELEQLAESFISFNVESKGKAEKGDQVTINAVGYVDGEAFDGGKLDNYKLVLGSKTFVDNFEDQLIGQKAGKDLVVNVTFPENYAKSLAGKKAEFKVEIVSVHKAEKPEINDELAKKLQIDSLDKLREQISLGMVKAPEEAIYTFMKMNLFNKLEDLLDFQIPESLLKKEYEAIKRQTSDISKDDESLQGLSDEEQDKYFHKVALRRIRIGLMLSKYTSDNKLKITENDIKNALMQQARQFPGHEEVIFNYYRKNPAALETLKGSIIEDLSVRHILDNLIKTEEKLYSAKSLEELLQSENIH